nr:hypothetical protein [Tanacetum cinerariifolium]
MEPLHPTDVDLLGTGAKYQEDQTQSSRLRIRLKKVRNTFWELVMKWMTLLSLMKPNISLLLLRETKLLHPLLPTLKHPTLILKVITSSRIKDDPITNKKIKEVSETLAKISIQNTEILSLVRSFDFSTLLTTVKNIQDHAFKQGEALAAWMKSFTNMAWNLVSKSQALREPKTTLSQSSLAPSSSVTLTFAITDTSVNVKGENATHTATKEPPFYTEGNTYTNIHKNLEEPKEGKGIATDDQEKDQRKLVKASSIVRPDPNEPDKKEKIKKAKEETRLNDISKTKVIKVVREEAKKIGIYLEEEISSKASELFKKAHDAKHEVLKRQHTKKIHSKSKLVVITVYKGIDGRNFNVHKPFLFGAFGISELDELGEISIKNKNTMVKDLINSLSQRWSHIDKVGMEALVSYLVATSMVKSLENARFSMKLRKLIAEHPDQEKLKSKKVKLEDLGYKMD